MAISIVKLLAFLLTTQTVCCEFQEFIKWKQISFENLLVDADQLGNLSFFTQYNNVPMGVTHHNNRLFITTPRRRVGIPSTLNVINLETSTLVDPPLKPYPNYNINELQSELKADSNRFVSVYRTRVDVCNRLWFVDTGMLEYPNNFIVIQRPSIWVIDLLTDEILRRYEIPSSLVDIGYGLTSVTIDVERDSCDDAFIYIPDLQTYRMIVYSYRENKAWRFLHNYFYLDPLQGDFDVAGNKYAWDDGLFSIALGIKNPDGFRTAYFHALSSISEFTVSTEILRNETASRRGYHGTDFQLLGTRGRCSQSGSHFFDPKTGVIFFTQINRYGVSCWNSKKSFVDRNFELIAHNTQTMIYPNDLNIDLEGNVWLMTNGIPIFIYSRFDTSQYNFRVFKTTVADAIKGTVCEDRHTYSSYSSYGSKYRPASRKRLLKV